MLACPRSSHPARLLARYASTGTPSILTLFHKTTHLLPRVLPSSSKLPTNAKSLIAADNAESDLNADPDSLEYWTDLLEHSFERVNAPSGEPVRVVVCGVDALSNPRDLVTALLEEPFPSEEAEARNQRIRARWTDSENVLGGIIAPDEPLPTSTKSKPPGSDPHTLHLHNSTFFQQFPVPFELHELPPPPLPQSNSTKVSKVSVGSTAADHILKADIPIILLNPLTTPLSSLSSSVSSLPSHSLTRAAHAAQRNPNAIIVLLNSTAPASFDVATYLHSQSSDLKAKILLANPARALSGLRAINTINTIHTDHSPPSASAIQTYQTQFGGSGVGEILSALKGTFESDSPASKSPATQILTRTSLTHLALALSACRRTLLRASASLAALSVARDALEKRVERVKAETPNLVLGLGNVERNAAVKEAVGESRRRVEGAMRGLGWWRVLWRVDDVSDVMVKACEGWGGLERRLVFHTGRLSAVQAGLTEEAFALVSTPSTPAASSATETTRTSSHLQLYSPILQNTLRQLTLNPSFALTPSSPALTAPLHTRQRLLAYPTARLHRSAQRVVLTAFSSLFGGAGVGFFGWFGWLGPAGFLDLSLLGLDSANAVGVGALGAAAGLRWGVGRWERAKKRWWGDWERVGEGLERDLEEGVGRVVRERVVRAAEGAVEGVGEVVERRRGEVEEVGEEVRVLEEEVRRALDSRS